MKTFILFVTTAFIKNKATSKTLGSKPNYSTRQNKPNEATMVYYTKFAKQWHPLSLYVLSMSTK